MTRQFDYGAEIAPAIEVYKLWPTEGSMTALIDGDMLPYIVGYTTEETRAIRAYSMAKFLYGNKEPDPSDWKWIECMLKQPYFQDKVDHLNSELNKWIALAKADSAIVYMTASETNFRIDIAFSHKYKGERVSTKPPFFYELRAYLKKMHNAIVSDGEEADDLMSIEAWRRIRILLASGLDKVGSPAHRQFADSIIVSKDKDLKIVPALHCDPTTGEITFTDELGHLEPVWEDKEVTVYQQQPLFGGTPYNLNSSDIYQDGDLYYMLDGSCQDVVSRGADKGKGKFKRVKAGVEITQSIAKLRGSGLKFFYAQLITGDTVDNYKGIAGCGPKVAYETLDNCRTEKECFEAVLQLYKNKRCSGGDKIWVENYRGGRALLTPYQLMLEQGRLAWMQTTAGEIWRSKHYCPSGVDDIWKEG